MKTLIVVALVVISHAASAQTYNTQRFNDSTFTRGPNGYNAQQQTFGDFTFGRDSQGNRWTAQRYGDQTFTKIVPGNR